MLDNTNDYAVIPIDRKYVTDYEKLTLTEGKRTISTIGEGFKLVRSGNYACGKDEMGLLLYPIMTVLKVNEG